MAHEQISADLRECPFWSDDFDMDLPKVIPDARAIVGDLADVKLFTTGHTTDGRLNSPDVWNGDDSMLAFFGFYHAKQRSTFYVSSSPTVGCTFWEALRDAWPHHYRMIVQDVPVWDTFLLQPEFNAIMWPLRGWGVHSSLSSEEAKAIIAMSLCEATETFRELVVRR